jgi:hypothetical protein
MELDDASDDGLGELVFSILHLPISPISLSPFFYPSLLAWTS